MKEDINNKITRIKTAFIDAVIDANIFQEELNELQRELENVKIKLNELEETKKILNTNKIQKQYLISKKQKK